MQSNIDEIKRFSITDLSDIDIYADPIDFELHLLAESFLDNTKREKILTTVKGADLQSADNRALFEHLSYHYKKDVEFDNLFKADTIAKFSQLFRFMRECQQNGNKFLDISTDYCIHYVVNQSYQKKLIQQLKAITTEADRLTSLDDKLDFIERVNKNLVNEYDERCNTNISTPIDELASNAYQYILDSQAGNIPFCTWGLDGMDDQLKLRPHGCFFVCARPGVGKTALAISCIIEQLTAGKTIALWCGEMTSEQIVMRFISQLAQISLDKLEKENGITDPNEFKRIELAVKMLSTFKLHLRCGEDLEMHELSKWAKQLYKVYDIDCLWLDYFTDIQPDIRIENRYEGMGDIARQIKSLKKELPIPIVTLAQLKRESNDRRPHKGDIAESSIVERVADGIVLIDREDEWTEDNDRKYKWFNKQPVKIDDMNERKLAVFIVDKNRFGAQGLRLYGFDGKHMRYTEQVAPPENQQLPESLQNDESINHPLQSHNRGAKD